jgi:outer membrane protein TolC
MSARTIAHTLILAAAVGGLSACASSSLDPAKDQARAAATIHDRTGLLDSTWPKPDPAEQPPAQIAETDAARLALTHEPHLRASLERIAVARADLVQSGLLPNPILSVDFGFHVGGPPGATQFSVSLVQQLAAILSRADRQSAADAALRAEVLNASDLALVTVAHARAAHARVLFAQAALEPMRESVAAAEKAVESTRKRAAAGEETSLEVNRQRLLLARMQAELIQREADLALRKRELLARIGLADRPADFTAIESGTGVPPVDSAPDSTQALLPTEDAAISAARTDRLDVAAARALADSSLAYVNVQRGSRFDFGAGPEFTRTDDERKELGAAINASIPIFDTGDARVARARADAARAALDADQAEQSAIAQARAAWITAKSARELAQRFETDIAALSSSNLTLAQQAFTAGQSDLTVLLETQQSAAEAKVRLVELKEKAALAEIELRRAVGR